MFCCFVVGSQTNQKQHNIEFTLLRLSRKACVMLYFTPNCCIFSQISCCSGVVECSVERHTVFPLVVFRHMIEYRDRAEIRSGIMRVRVQKTCGRGRIVDFN